jgi:hypothetical protein
MLAILIPAAMLWRYELIITVSAKEDESTV